MWNACITFSRSSGERLAMTTAVGSRSASSRVSSNQIHNHSLERTVVSPAPHSNPPGGADATAEPPQSLRSERQ